ncbi:Transcriptional regulatory protein ZraR [Rosistilla oblonga]|uniref:sigma-54-dependent transcriptional regulator n=1 Tax=Rosistilla oblonga TaxID=2527990 RepID=UPI00118B980F|nr:sigma-54 dependent transcriptional regulator [Rosistilla oblonga]QDV10894.1 Transcriptional regulatory protein ZraR [Rosistilla oblonga]
MTLNPKLLLVDDDRRLAESMADWLRFQQFNVDQAHSLAGGRRAIQEQTYDLMLLDLRLEDGDGFALIAETKRRQPDCAILVLTGYATPNTAIEAVQAGAFDLLTKPLVDEELSHALERALAQQNIQAENEKLRAQLDSRFGLEHILSHDYRMLKIFDVIDSVADARASVLITGENGTGKSMIARAVHKRSNRRNNPFVEVACGALPDNLLESELFGHVIGSFTGATTNKVGKFKQADGGTIFLDEIGTASQAFQVKLLRVLQELQFEPLGGTETETVDTRVILATNENLAQAVSSGQFRQDLFYRVNVINIELPALRERSGDVPLLVDHFLREVCETTGRDVQGFDRDALAILQSYAWPGNVRELENVVERAVLLARDSVLTRNDLPPHLLSSSSNPRTASDSFDSPSTLSSDSGSGQTLREALEEPERRIILESLRLHNWNRAATADTLGVNRTTLYKKMKRLGLDDPRLQFMGAEAR